MGSFNRGGNRGGGGRFFGRDGFGRKDFDRSSDRGSQGGFGGGRGEREMFKTTCSNCGRECEVPFRPTNSKPVYCNDCFPKFSGRGDDRRGGDRPRFGDRRPVDGSDQYKGQFENLNIKLDKILRLLQPVSGNSTPAVVPVKPEAPKKKADKSETTKEMIVMESAAISEVTEAPKAEKTSSKKPSKVKKD